MQVCKSIEKVQGGYIVEIPFPYANYSDGQKRVCQSWDEVVELLSRAAHEEPSTAEPVHGANGLVGNNHVSREAMDALAAIGKASGNITPAADFISGLEMQLADLQGKYGRHIESLSRLLPCVRKPEETITDDEIVARAIQQLADKRVVPGLLSPHATEVLTAIGKASGNITPAADYIFTLEQQLADLQAERDRYREALEKIKASDSVAAGWIAAAALKSPSPIAPEEAQG